MPDIIQDPELARAYNMWFMELERLRETQTPKMSQVFESILSLLQNGKKDV